MQKKDLWLNLWILEPGFKSPAMMCPSEAQKLECYLSVIGTDKEAPPGLPCGVVKAEMESVCKMITLEETTSDF